MQKVFFALLALIAYLYYDSTLGHHFLITEDQKLLGKCTSSYEYLDLHVEAFNCKENYDEDVPYIIFNCNYKGKKYTLYDLNSYQDCKAVSKSLKKDDAVINTKRKKIISTNFGIKRKSIFDGIMGAMSSAFENDPKDIRYGIRHKEEAAIKRIKPISDLGKDDMDKNTEEDDIFSGLDEKETEEEQNIEEIQDVDDIKDVNKRRLEIYRRQNGY